MSFLAPVLDKHPITMFCESEIGAHGANRPIDEEALATDFIAFFDARRCVTYRQFVDLCARLSIEVSLVDLPEEKFRASVLGVLNHRGTSLKPELTLNPHRLCLGYVW